MLREDVDLNFKSQLGILLDPRYGSRESQQEERFQEAVEGATLALEHLRNTAKDKAKEAGNIVAALVAVSEPSPRLYHFQILMCYFLGLV